MDQGFATIVLTLAVAAGCGGESRAIEDGRHFAYVKSVDASSAPTLSVDVADFLIGDEANRAAVAAGAIEEGESVPNDYFVRNEDEATVTVPVAADVRVTHIQCAPTCREKIPGRFDAFAASFREGGSGSLADEYRGAESQYWITVADGEVTAIDEQYLP